VENRRIREVYAQRSEPGTGPLDPYGLYLYHELLEALAIFFRSIGLVSLANLRMLDVGCGSGGMLWRLQAFGARPSNCSGVDLLREGLRVARRVSPEVDFVEGNAARLPFEDGAFDVVFQFLMFSSILDREVRKAAAAEILRALRPGGYFVSYDMRYSNPQNPNVCGIRRGEIKKLFPGCQLRFRRLTLAPPIGRCAARISPALCRILSMFPVLRTHDLCFARKPELTRAR
jgi:SAM-dependent methyltransferase